MCEFHRSNLLKELLLTQCLTKSTLIVNHLGWWMKGHLGSFRQLPIALVYQLQRLSWWVLCETWTFLNVRKSVPQLWHFVQGEINLRHALLRGNWRWCILCILPKWCCDYHRHRFPQRPSQVHTRLHIDSTNPEVNSFDPGSAAKGSLK